MLEEAQHTSNAFYYYPDTMAKWPWQRQINPHFEEVAAESEAWLKSLGIFGEQLLPALDRCCSGQPYNSQSHPG